MRGLFRAMFVGITCGMCSFAITQTVTTSGGTPNVIPKFTSGSQIGDSHISDLNGNIGIGTLTTGSTLTVLGSSYFDKSSMTAGGLYNFYSVGYSAVNPFPSQGVNTDWSGLMLHQIFGNGSSHHFGFSIYTDNQMSPTYAKARIDAWRDGNGVAPDLEFATDSAPRMTLTAIGNVGIGTTSPLAKLDVAGSVKISGTGASMTFPDNTVQSTAWNGTTCGGDYAESVDVAGDRKTYEPGDVLVIDPEHESGFLKSSETYATGVTGVFSTKPGLTGRRQLTAKSDEEVPMAMVGIVPTKVSAENGAIKPGDLLVSSSKTGYAMKGTDRSKMLGAVIGKVVILMQ